MSEPMEPQSQPEWNRIANKMLPEFKHIGEYPEACKKLQRVNELAQKAGGELKSHQVIAGILADFDLT